MYWWFCLGLWNTQKPKNIKVQKMYKQASKQTKNVHINIHGLSLFYVNSLTRLKHTFYNTFNVSVELFLFLFTIFLPLYIYFSNFWECYYDWVAPATCLLAWKWFARLSNVAPTIKVLAKPAMNLKIKIYSRNIFVFSVRCLTVQHLNSLLWIFFETLIFSI